MSPGLRVAIALPCVGLHIAVGFTIIALAFPFMSHATRSRLIRWWSRYVLAICGVRVRVIGPGPGIESAAASSVANAMRPGGIGAMLVMNHISWLDIHVVHSQWPARFIAKAEIARWPILGYLTDRTGTIFIERGKRHAVREVNHRAAQLLRDGELVAMFPEGTTSDGDRLLPFHVNLIQSAIDARATIVVAGLRYLDRQGRLTSAASYVGDINLLQSIVRLIRMGPVTAELHLIDAIDVFDGAVTVTRHEVGQRARALIAEALGFDDEREEAAEGISTVIVVPDAPQIDRGAAGAGRPGAARRTEMEIDARDELL